MTEVNIHEAKTHLSRLLIRVAAGIKSDDSQWFRARRGGEAVKAHSHSCDL